MNRRQRKALDLGLAVHGCHKVKLGCCGVEVTAASMHAIAHRDGCAGGGGRGAARERAFARAQFPAFAAELARRVADVARDAEQVAQGMQGAAEAVTDFAAAYRASLTDSVDHGREG